MIMLFAVVWLLLLIPRDYDLIGKRRLAILLQDARAYFFSHEDALLATWSVL